MIKQWLGLILGKFVVSVAGNFELGSTSVFIFALCLCFYSRCLFFRRGINYFLLKSHIQGKWTHLSDRWQQWHTARRSWRGWLSANGLWTESCGFGSEAKRSPDSRKYRHTVIRDISRTSRPFQANRGNVQYLSWIPWPSGPSCSFSSPAPPYVHHFVQPFKNSLRKML